MMAMRRRRRARARQAVVGQEALMCKMTARRTGRW
jgi:hypothetical protein